MKKRTSFFGFFYSPLAAMIVLSAIITLDPANGFATANVVASTNSITCRQKLSQGMRIGRPLIWVGAIPPEESECQELWQAFVGDERNTTADVSGSLEHFIKSHPNSAWRSSLEIFLGENDFKRGYFSKALERWQTVWNESKGLTDKKGRQIADAALVDRLELMASLGRTDSMKELLDETKGRQISVQSHVHYERLRSAYAHMLHHPDDSYRCGTFALNAVMQALYGTNRFWEFAKLKSPEAGFSMAELQNLSDSNHLGLIAVERTTGSELVTPSVVHWKENHYAAIVKKQGDLYEVVDPTFKFNQWLTASAINEESSGQFLIRVDQTPAGWRRLSQEEAANIHGKGWPPGVDQPGTPPCICPPPCPPGSDSTGSGSDDNSDSGDDDSGSGDDPLASPSGSSSSGGCSTCGAHDNILPVGMPTWGVTEPDLNVWVEDRPLAYQTATAGRFSFKIYYNEETYGSSSGFPSTMGLWASSWESMIAAFGPGTETAILFPPGGGQQTYTNFDATVPDFYTRNRMLLLTNTDGSTAGYQILHPDGSADLYTLSEEITSMPGIQQTNYYWTENISPHGRTTIFLYDVNYLLVSVIDPDGKTNTLTYTANGDYTLITQVQDPYTNITTFAYYPDSPYITNVTDMAGMTTSFAYNDSVGMTNMTTPYGPTSFALGGPVDSATGEDIAWIYDIITKPNGDQLMFLYAEGYQFAGVPEVYTDTSNVPTNRPVDNAVGTNTLDNPDWNNPSKNDAMNLANSFYWNPQQFANLSPSFLSSLSANGPIGSTFDELTTNDYANARMRHYNENPFDGQGRSLSMQRQPSPNGYAPGKMTWYDYPGKLAYNVQGFGQGYYLAEGASAFPSMIIKVLPDGSEAYKIYQVDQLQNPTNIISTYSINGTVLQRTNRYIYSTNGVDLIEAIGPDGVTQASYVYDSGGLHLVLFITNAVGYVTSYTYNTNAQVTSITEPTGLIITNIYDANGFLRTNYSYATSGAFFGTNSYTYTNGLVLTQTDARGLTKTYTWDSLMRVTNLAYPNGSISYTYNNLDLIKVVDRLGYSTAYGYNSIRQKIAATNALNNHTLFSYCLCGGLDSMQDGLGFTTYFNYDYGGHRISKVYPDGYSRTNNFNAIDQVTNTIDGLGISTTNWFNNQGLLVAVSNAFGLVRRMSYDIDDRLTNQIDANGVSINITYDNLGRMLSRGYPDGGVEDFGYSPAGLITYTNQLGEETEYTYDAARRKIAETNANNGVTQYGYNAASDLVSLTDQNNHATQWGYDLYGRVTNKVDATSTTILKYGYDADNRLTNRWSAEKGNTGYAYDAVGNLTGVTYPVSSALSFSYDADNRMTGMSDAIGATSFTYTPVGQLASETGPWASDAVAYTYSDRMRTVLDLQQPNASDWIVDYGYDAAKRLQTVTSPAGQFTYSYNPGVDGNASSSGLVANIALPNGAWITNTYDNNGRMTGTYLYNSGATSLDASVYIYNVGNQRTSVQREAGENYANYTYDPIGQVVADQGYETTGSTPRLNEQLHYGFDPAGNLAHRTNNALMQTFYVNSVNELTTNSNSGTLTVVGTTTSAATNVSVNGNNSAFYGDATFAATNLPLTTNYTAVAQDVYGRVSSNSVSVSLSTNVTFQYDANGNLTNDGLRSFAYDDENELIEVWVTNQWMSKFTYDGKMRRRIRQEFTWRSSSWLQTNAVYYVYDGNLVVQERDANNLPTTTYTRGKDLSGSFEGAGGIGGLLARTAQSYSDAPLNGQSYYHSDGNGNITMLINDTQTVMAKYLYDAFGNILAKSGLLADANVYRFSSKEAHSNSRLVYYLYRYYDANLQRWLNQDPIQELGGVNLFVFVLNRVANAMDIFGLDLHFPGLPPIPPDPNHGLHLLPPPPPTEPVQVPGLYPPSQPPNDLNPTPNDPLSGIFPIVGQCYITIGGAPPGSPYSPPSDPSDPHSPPPTDPFPPTYTGNLPKVPVFGGIGIGTTNNLY
jgi:RHS repeat-associated protein